MDMRYQIYCFADPRFYDTPERWGNEAETTYSETTRELPAGWSRKLSGGWHHAVPPSERSLPKQGWKIHVSSCVEDAAEVLSSTWEYCVAGGIPFKFLPTRSVFVARNMKYADRGGSGKFITIYPWDEKHLQEILEELGPRLAGRHGPYVLSDLRWGDGPLYVRYGGFVQRMCRDELGDLVPAIEDPSGTLVPDVRTPVFSPPEWVTLPDFLASHLARLGDDAPPEDFPYAIERALHYSNGGGIYLARDTRTNRQVVLKEARPHAGLDPAGRDAVARLQRERDFLRALADVDEAVGYIDYFQLWEHHFLVQEYVEGEVLAKAMLARYPLVQSSTDDDKIAEYTAWALDTVEQVATGLAHFHSRGIAFCDVHPHNILVRPDGRVVFVDFETACHDHENEISRMGAPGYVPPDPRRGVEVDRYALACLRLSVFLPLTVLFPLDVDKAASLADAIAERFPVPGGFREQVLEELALTPLEMHGTEEERRRVRDLVRPWDRGVADWPAVRASVVAAILDSATPDREDRLFPGDVGQFIDGNGFGLAYGAAGVLDALARTGHGRWPDHEDWLLRRVRAGDSDRHVGFYDGLHGIAYAFDQLGRPDVADEVLERALRAPLPALPSDLFSGLAGVGLNALHFFGRTGRADLLDVAVTVGDLLADRLEPVDEPMGESVTAVGKAGLMHGYSGPAAFFVRLFEETGEERQLDRADRALRLDLRYCPTLADGSVQVNEGWRVLPYLGTGSIGVAVALRQFLRHRHDPDFAAKAAGVRLSCQAEFVIGAPLFNGRAGVIAFLSSLRDPERPDPDLESLIEQHLHRLAWHALCYRGNVAFPGDQLQRLSMDVATGSAGVLLAMHAALGGTGVGAGVPVLEPAAPRRLLAAAS